MDLNAQDIAKLKGVAEDAIEKVSKDEKTKEAANKAINEVEKKIGKDLPDVDELAKKLGK